jgi:capsular polysaccharide biosynthesis protein
MGEEIKEKEVEIRLTDLWGVLKQCWLLVLITLIAVFSVVYIFAKVNHEPEYSATVKIYAKMERPEGSAIASGDFTIAEKLIEDCQEMLLSEDNVLNPVLEEQQLSSFLDSKGLSKMISYKASTKSDRILLLTVTSPDRTRSADLANSVANHVCDYLNEDLYGRTLFHVTETAKVPTRESNGVSALKIGLLAVVCAVAVYAVFLIKFLLDDKIGTGEDVEKYLGVSVLGMIPNRGIKQKKYRAYYKRSYGRYGQSSSSTYGKH